MSNQSDPSSGFAAVSTSDTAILSNVRALYIGTGGDLVAQTAAGKSVTFKAVPTGLILPIKATRVMATNTTAADIVALY